MKKRFVFALIALAFVSIGSMAFQSLKPSAQKAESSSGYAGLSLSPPTIEATGSFLDNEAGLAGYAQVAWNVNNDPILWSRVKAQLQTVEKEGSDYIIGTFGLTDYATKWDPHVYVTKDGWVVVYWPRNSSPALFLDLQSGLGQNHVDRVVSSIAAAGGASTPTISYFDFAHPTANRLVIVPLTSVPNHSTDEVNFSITIPQGAALLDGGWAFWHSGSTCFYTWSGLYIEEQLLACEGYRDASRDVASPQVGTLSSSSLPVDIETAFQVKGMSGGRTFTSLVLLVRE